MEDSNQNRRRLKKRLLILVFTIVVMIIGGYFAIQNPRIRRFVKSIVYYQTVTHKEFGIRIPTKYSVHGIDVSHHQGKIDWKKVKAMNDKGVTLDFVFIKATEGQSYSDNKFNYNWKKSKENGIIRGAYHYFKPNVDGAIQAKYFISKVELVKGDLPPVIDVEEIGNVSKSKLMKEILKFAKVIELKYKVKPIIYTYHDFYKLNFDKTFKDYKLWIAHYYVRKPYNNSWNFWQYTDKGKVSGINYPVDFNVYNRSLEKMKLILVK